MDHAQKILFLQKVQRLLDEGEFVATYKFALLQSLADLSIESPVEDDQPLRLSVDQIAAKFIEYYWRQAVPYRQSEDSDAGLLMHNTGQQAAVVNRVMEARARFGGNLSRAQSDATYWDRLTRTVAKVVVQMPLWKLQIVAGKPDEFLYRKSDFNGSEVILLAGIASCFRSFHGLVTRLVRSSWVDQIRAIRSNTAILGESPDLEEFLFGSERRPLEKLRPILEEVQSSRCFYSGRKLGKSAEVDHFIPWSRYPIDLGHNFVLAHPDCNRRKSDFLAHKDHLARWVERNEEHGKSMEVEFEGAGFQHDINRSLLVARWAYENAEKTQSHVWTKERIYLPLTPDWREVLASA